MIESVLRCALLRAVSTPDQQPETQLAELRGLHRGAWMDGRRIRRSGRLRRQGELSGLDRLVKDVTAGSMLASLIGPLVMRACLLLGARCGKWARPDACEDEGRAAWRSPDCGDESWSHHARPKANALATSSHHTSRLRGSHGVRKAGYLGHPREGAQGPSPRAPGVPPDSKLVGMTGFEPVTP